VAPPRRSGARPGRVLAVLGVLILVMLITITGKDTLSPGKWQSQFKVGLGLDLSSGTQVTLQAQVPGNKPPSAGDMSQAVSVIQSRVDGTGNTNAQVQQQGSNLINVSVPGKAPQQVVNLISTTAQLRFRPVYLEQLATAVTPTATPTPTPTGTSPPSPSPTGTASPKPSPSASASATKAKTSALIVRDSAKPKASASATPKAAATPTASATPSPAASSAASTAFGDPSKVNAATMKLFNKLVCTPSNSTTTVNDSWKPTVGYTPQLAQYDVVGNQIVSCDSAGNKYVLGQAIFTGEDIRAVSAGLPSSGTTGWIVNITLDGKASSAFGTLTTNQFNNYFPSVNTNSDDSVLDENAVVLDGDVIAAPQTGAALTSGTFEINGGSVPFTESYATYLQNVLKFGQLPLSFTQQSVSSISPQLGHDSLVAGLLAGIIGLILVVIYLFAYYRGLGLVSVSSLIIAGSLSYLTIVLLSRYQGFTMELAGIAGLVVAIGITADSFIVFFERLRDEVRDGKSLRPAVESGWKRARRTILVSDTVSFTAAVLLYFFATSQVQGFAFTLGLTTVIDVVVVFLFTKPMVTILAGTKFFGNGHRWSGLDPKRLGAKTPWRSGIQRTTVRRPHRTAAGARASSTSATSPKEA
jgi:preprotein translocase subunit SecD